MNEEHYEYKYTIVIPHHEIPQLLKRCVESIPERDDIQIIVVDDNSKDNEKYLDMYPFLRRKNLEYYPTKEGKGAGYARNVGLDHAKGKWLLFCDSDDFYTEDAFEVFDKEISDDIDIMYFNVNLDYCNYKGFNRINEVYANYLIDGNDKIIRFSYWQPWNKVIAAKVVFDNNIRFEEVPVGNDALFALNASFYCKRFKIIQDKLYNYTTSNTMALSAAKMDFDREMLHLAVRLRINEFYVKHGYYKRFLNLIAKNHLKDLQHNFGTKKMLIYLAYVSKYFGLLRCFKYRIKRKFYKEI